MRLDLLDVVQERLKEAGIKNVRLSRADASRLNESCTLLMGVPEEDVGYFDCTFTTRVRVSALCRRLREEDAMSDAYEARHALAHAPLESRNGSYRLVGVEAGEPRPVLWDESGRNVWVVEATVEIERND